MAAHRCDWLEVRDGEDVRAVVLKEPGAVENLEIRDLPVPEPPPGWVRLAVKAFGLTFEAR